MAGSCITALLSSRVRMIGSHCCPRNGMARGTVRNRRIRRHGHREVVVMGIGCIRETGAARGLVMTGGAGGGIVDVAISFDVRQTSSIMAMAC